MKLKRVNIFLLSIAYIFALHNAYIYADDIPNKSNESFESVNEEQDLQDLLSRAIRQTDSIDFAFEQIAYGVNNNSIQVANKDKVKDYIGSVRKQISISKNDSRSFRNKLIHIGHIKAALETNGALIKQLKNFTKSNLQELPESEEHTSILDVPKKSDKIDYWEMTTDEARTTLDNYDDELTQIGTSFGNLGFSIVNRAVKLLEKINKNFHITTIAKRAIPYGLLGVYYVFTASPGELAGYDKKADPNKEPEHWLQKLKWYLGGMPKKGKATKTKVDTQEASKLQVDGIKVEALKVIPVPAEPVERIEAEMRRISNQMIGARNDRITSQTIERDDLETVPGLMGTPVAKLGRFINFDTKQFFHFSAAGIMAPIIKKDAEDLIKFGSKQFKKAYAFLKGEPFEDDSPIKKSKIVFKDIVGFDHAKHELNKVVQYFKKKDDFDRAGAFVDRGYLLVGQSDIAKSLAQGLAGEITNLLKEKGKKEICGFYEIHASQLLDKKLKDIIKEAEEKSPCILIIDQIDWLSADKQVKPEIWSDLVTSMSSTLRSPKKQVFIVATAQDSKSIDRAIHDQGRLGITIQLGQTTFEARKAYFAKELKDRVIDVTSFDLEYAAKQTEGASIQQLAKVIKRAIAHAQENRETLQQKHIEISIDEVVHNIMPTSINTNNKDKAMLAAHYAGKAAAHMLLVPNRLNKVTIMPIAASSTTIKHGSIIAYKPQNADLFMTQNDIENSCIIELAGLEAQQILLNNVSVALISEAKKHVFDVVKKAHFEGINEKDLPRTIKEQKLAQVWQIIKDYSAAANKLVTQNIAKVKAIASALEQNGTISAETVSKL